jgi:gamma-glutamylcysteine synthetase
MKIDKNDLINFFNNGCKKPENRMIGTEHEKFLFNLTTCKPVNIRSSPLPNSSSIDKQR